MGRIKFETSKDKYKNKLIEMLKELTEEEWDYLFFNGTKYWKKGEGYFTHLTVGPNIRFSWERKVMFCIQMRKETATATFGIISLFEGYFGEVKESEVKMDVWVDFLVKKFGNRYINLVLQLKLAMLKSRLESERFKDTWGEYVYESMTEGNLDEQIKALSQEIKQIDLQTAIQDCLNGKTIEELI